MLVPIRVVRVRRVPAIVVDAAAFGQLADTAHQVLLIRGHVQERYDAGQCRHVRRHHVILDGLLEPLDADAADFDVREAARRKLTVDLVELLDQPLQNRGRQPHAQVRHVPRQLGRRQGLEAFRCAGQVAAAGPEVLANQLFAGCLLGRRHVCRRQLIDGRFQQIGRIVPVVPQSTGRRPVRAVAHIRVAQIVRCA